MDNIKWQTLLLQTDMYEWLEKKAEENGTDVTFEILVLIATEMCKEEEQHEKSEQ